MTIRHTAKSRRVTENILADFSIRIKKVKLKSGSWEVVSVLNWNFWKRMRNRANPSTMWRNATQVTKFCTYEKTLWEIILFEQTLAACENKPTLWCCLGLDYQFALALLSWTCFGNLLTVKQVILRFPCIRKIENLSCFPINIPASSPLYTSGFLSLTLEAIFNN